MIGWHLKVCMSGHERGTEEGSVASVHGVLLLSVEVKGWKVWEGEAVRVGCMYVVALPLGSFVLRFSLLPS